MAATVAHPATMTAGRTGQRPNCQTRHGHALPVYAQTVIGTARALRRQPRIHVVQAQVDQGRPTGDDLAARVDEGVGEDGHRLHPKLQALVEVRAVEHPASDILNNKNNN